MNNDHSKLLQSYLPALTSAARKGPILDLACGNGRNGPFLLTNNIPVVFSDVNPAALKVVDNTLSTETLRDKKVLAELCQADFELENSTPQKGRQYGGVIVFRYLYRPLLRCIRESVAPGGIVVYETFTIDQPQYGRPKNPDFLLRHGELQSYFSDWHILYSFEGALKQNEDSDLQAVAQIVALKPEQPGVQP